MNLRHKALVLLSIGFILNSTCFGMVKVINNLGYADESIFKHINEPRSKEFRNTFSKRFNYDFESKKFTTPLNEKDKVTIENLNKFVNIKQTELADSYKDGKCPETDVTSLIKGTVATAIGILPVVTYANLANVYAKLWAYQVRDILNGEYGNTQEIAACYAFIHPAITIPLIAGVGYVAYKALVRSAIPYFKRGLNNRWHLFNKNNEATVIKNDFDRIKQAVDNSKS